MHKPALPGSYIVRPRCQRVGLIPVLLLIITQVLIVFFNNIFGFKIKVQTHDFGADLTRMASVVRGRFKSLYTPQYQVLRIVERLQYQVLRVLERFKFPSISSVENFRM